MKSAIHTGSYIWGEKRGLMTLGFSLARPPRPFGTKGWAAVWLVPPSLFLRFSKFITAIFIIHLHLDYFHLLICSIQYTYIIFSHDSQRGKICYFGFLWSPSYLRAKL